MEPILNPNNDQTTQTIVVNQIDNNQNVSIEPIENAQSIPVNPDVEFLRGYSPTIDVEEVEEGYNITITDVNHTETVLIPSGDDLTSSSQDLTEDECDQIRSNTRSGGKYLENLPITPYEIVEIDGYIERTMLDPIIAPVGAEVYNDYEFNVATGIYSHAEGYSTQAKGDYSHAEGYCTIASGEWSHASGWSSVAGGYCAIANGRNAKASGNYSIAEGIHTQATRNNAHAEGDTNTASANNTHSEGYISTASGNQSHAEGWSTTASGVCAHTEGEFTIARGRDAWAGGMYTEASGRAAMACGERTIAAGRAQFVCGKYNVSDSTSLLIVGNGTADTARSNAFKIDASGNCWHSGTVEGTALILKSSTEGSTKRFKITVDDSGTLSAVQI